MNEIIHVLPVGGSCQAHFVHQLLHNKFGEKVVKNPSFKSLTSVCEGACFLAHEEQNAPGKFKVYQKVPHNIGFEIERNKFEAFITPNDKLPFQDEKIYYLHKIKWLSLVHIY